MAYEQRPALRSRRLKILEPDEIDELYGLPRFSDDERDQYFTLKHSEKVVIDELHSVKSKIAFIIQLGYFKARRTFFVFGARDVAIDMLHVAERYFPNIKRADCVVTKVTRLKHQRLIISLCRYKSCDDIDRQHLEKRAQEAAMVCSKPIYVFRQVLLELEARRLMIPGYTFLQDAIGQALNFEQSRLTNILRAYLTHSDERALNTLLDDKSDFYSITHLKHEPSDFSAAEIKREINRGVQIRELYRLSQRILPSLKISNESIKYYASLVGYYYSVFRLKRFEPWTVYTYLLCFIHFRYQHHYDNLLISFIFYVRKFSEAAKLAASNRVHEYRVEANQNLFKAAQVLKLFTSDEIGSNAPFHEVQAKAFAILEREKLDHVAENIKREISFDETAFQWEHIDKMGFQFKRYLRPILLSTDFKGAPAQTRLIEGIDFLKTLFSKRPYAWAIPYTSGSYWIYFRYHRTPHLLARKKCPETAYPQPL